MDESVQEQVTFWSWCLDHWAFVAFCIGCVVQITPIKISPFTALFRWIGKIVNKDVSSQIVDIQRELTSQGERIDANEMDRIRWEILDFANSCRNGRKHSKREFEHIFDLDTKYSSLLERINVKNGVYEEDFRYIKEVYAENMKNNSFLK